MGNLGSVVLSLRVDREVNAGLEFVHHDKRSCNYKHQTFKDQRTVCILRYVATAVVSAYLGGGLLAHSRNILLHQTAPAQRLALAGQLQEAC